MEHKYILDENDNPIPEPDLIAWAEWIETYDRTVEKTRIGDKLISTVFLGILHDYVPEIGWNGWTLYETAIFYDNGNCDIIERYQTKEDALEGHARIVNSVKLSDYNLC